MAFIPPKREKMSTKSFFKWFRETIFVVPIAFSILYNMLLYCTNIWHCFGKNKELKYQARQSRLGSTARQWLLYPTPVIRELVPSSHQRSELSNTILCIFSGWDQRIGEGIPIPDSLAEEATFINICIGNGSLKCHRVLIPTTPSFGDKVICWYTGFTFKTFI